MCAGANKNRDAVLKWKNAKETETGRPQPHVSEKKMNKEHSCVCVCQGHLLVY